MDSEAKPRYLTFDAVEVDLVGRRVMIAGVEVALEPKAFDVFALLAQAPGKAFPRDEILDAVWGHRHVTPGVLNRVITLIRQALSENAENAQYLRTLHGVGYRFDAAVRVSAQRASTKSAAATPADRDLLEEAAQTANVIATASDVAAHSAGSTIDIARALPAAPVLTQPAQTALPPRARLLPLWYWLAASGALLLIALAYRALISTPTQYPPAATTSAPTLVVLPLRTVGNEQAETTFAEGLSEELTMRLARIEGLSLISQTSAALAQERKLDLDQLAKQLHVSHALEGSLREAGDQLRIDLRLVEVPGGKTVWAQDYDRKLADVFAIQSEIAQAVSGALALHLGLAAKVEAGGSADNVALYRQYLELRSTLLIKPDFATRGQHIAAAREALRAMIAHAPDYARAHGLLARSFNTQVTGGSGPTPAQLDEAAQEAARALQLDPDNSDAHAAIAELACRRMDWDNCMTEYRRTLALDPTDVSARGAYSYRLSGIGYLDTALSEFDTAHRSDPLNTAVAWTRVRLLDTLGRHDEAKHDREVFVRQDASLLQASIYARWFNALWRHDYADAQEAAVQMPEKDGFRESSLAVTAALQDSSLWPNALKAIEESERRTGLYNLARLLGPGYDATTAFARLTTMLQNGYPSYFMLVWQPEYAALRRDPAFQDFLHRTRIIDYWRAHGWPPQCKPDGDGARCE